MFFAGNDLIVSIHALARSATGESAGPHTAG